MRFNAKNSSSRSLEQIKIKYDNLIRKAWKVAASNNKYIVGTGDGPSQKPMSDPVLINTVPRIVNAKTVVGLENPCDSDGTFVKLTEQICTCGCSSSTCQF